MTATHGSEDDEDVFDNLLSKLLKHYIKVLQLEGKNKTLTMGSLKSSP